MCYTHVACPPLIPRLDICCPFRNIIPENIVQACLQSAYTDIGRELSEISMISNGSLVTESPNNTETVISITRKLMYRDRMNTLGESL